MIPWYENCPHSENGWCLNCVSKLGDKMANLRDFITRARHESSLLQEGQGNDLKASIVVPYWFMKEEI